MTKQHYDIIGDIHGQATELIQLLEKMGYRQHNGCYQHPSRKVIFLGDFIDRGKQQRLVLETVMAMIQQGSALSVIGNHEFNAMAFHTPNPDNPDDWLRPHSMGNNQQHQAFLDEYNDDSEELNKVLNFFYTLPLFLDLDGLRIIHASWEPNWVQSLKPDLNSDNTLTKELLIKASTKGSHAYKTVESLIKGVEYKLPNGITFDDKDGHPRKAVRTQWWRNTDCTLGEIAIPANFLDQQTANITIKAEELVGYLSTEKPLFLGHYWMVGEPVPLADNVACLDYSVAKPGGKLVAYRWDGEQKLSKDKFIWIEREAHHDNNQ
ncbi:MAG: diadenosine tetraphosphatase [Methylococcales bacterium]|nr:diadenosine tetraphosphatase [Methylococcales bacterium]MBT7408967.1 diadenosine tetraphosphatase [Methylococcales bacterium]